MTPELLTAPMPAIRALGRGTEEPGRSGHLALWGCHLNDAGFWCPSTLLRTVSLSNGRSTIVEAVVAALKRDPHDQDNKI